jgi:hypothetical protein
MSRFRQTLELPVLGEASGEDVRYIVRNIAIELQGSQMVVPEVPWDYSWHTVCGSLERCRASFRNH